MTALRTMSPSILRAAVVLLIALLEYFFILPRDRFTLEPHTVSYPTSYPHDQLP
jgi:hypothetical protein